MNSSNLIEVRKVSYKHRGTQILKGVNFCVNRGDRLAIVGPNGAGKSTLLKLLLGLIRCTSGSVTLGGNDLRMLSRMDIARSMAYVPQLLQSEVAFTVREFVAMGRYAHKGDGGDEAIDRALSTVSMIGFEHRSVSSLSGGERQRVCIAAALAQGSSIIVFDEPLAHLDPRQKMEVQNVLHRLDPSITQIVVSHDLDWVSKCFTRVVAINEGSVDYEGSVGDFHSKGVAVDLFGDLSLDSLGGER